VLPGSKLKFEIRNWLGVILTKYEYKGESILEITKDTISRHRKKWGELTLQLNDSRPKAQRTYRVRIFFFSPSQKFLHFLDHWRFEDKIEVGPRGRRGWKIRQITSGDTKISILIQNNANLFFFLIPPFSTHFYFKLLDDI